MPTYEYHCEKCDQIFELFQSMKADPLTTCIDESCGGRVRRLIGAGAGLIFKGSGFYITDYRSNTYKEAAKKETSSPPPAAKSESKPAAPAGSSAPASS